MVYLLLYNFDICIVQVKHHHHHLKIPVAVPIPAKPPSYVSEYYAGPTLDHPPGPYDSPPEVSNCHRQ